MLLLLAAIGFAAGHGLTLLVYAVLAPRQKTDAKP